MHSNLMKRYEKELKVNIQHMDTINHLNVSSEIRYHMLIVFQACMGYMESVFLIYCR